MRIEWVGLWCALAALASATVAAVTWGEIPLEETAGELLLSLGVLTVVSAVYFRIRYVYGDGWDLPAPKLMWLVPAAVTAILAPVLVSGADSTGEGIAGVGLFLLAAYGTVLLGLLVLLLVLLPIELLGRGMLLVVSGRPGGGWPLFTGSIALIATAFGVVGAFALDGLPTGRAAFLPVLLSLLGVPVSGVVVVSPVLLWVARILLVLLVALMLAAAHFPQRAAARREQEHARDAAEDRDRRADRADRQRSRDRQRRAARED